jgi:uncharacterized protein YdeI (BOF family)
MKNIVTAFALALVATGAFASSQINNNASQTVAASKASAFPTPFCDPSSDGCSIQTGK